MHDQDMAIVRALIPVAWADGVYADKEKETIDALLDAYNASEKERTDIHTYASQKRTIDDINLQELSADDRRVLLQHAVLLCYVDNDFSTDEQKFVEELGARLKIPTEEAKALIFAAGERARKLLALL
jgi:uncharacterized membrane protein YebE (DUF533 family)